MRVDDSLIQFHALKHHHVEGHGKKDGLEAVKERGDHGHHHHEGKVHGHDRHDSVDISEEAKTRFESMKKRSEETRERHFSVPGGLDPKALLNRLVHGVFGGSDINVTGLLEQGQGAAPASQAEAAGQTPVVSPDQVVQPGDTQAAAGAAGFSASVEKLSFSASGTIKTADGEEVGFTLALNVTKASMSGNAAGTAQDANGVSVNFGGSSAELFSMSFKFNIASDEEGEQSGVGSFKVEKPETDSVADDDDVLEAHEEHGEHSLVSDVHDFMKLLRRAEFTSTYLSFSKTTVEASSAFASIQPADALSAPPVDTGATAPVDLVA